MNCKGSKRGINALRMKLKNLKSQSKRGKLESDDETIEQHVVDEDGKVQKFVIVKKRKRCKMFTPEENELLQKLVEKYTECLDTSQTRSAIENRNKSWQSIVDEFNAANLNISRDINELKIKYKNMKSKGTSFKIEDTSDQIINEEIIIEPQSPPKPITSTVKKPRNLQQKTRLEILASLEDSDDELDESGDDIDVSLDHLMLIF